MLSKEITDLPYHVGTRIFSDGENGTVKFVGEIESQEGIWLGIEWDNPSRGKHSGTYKNTSYFHTSVPNSGSFIRPWKADTGISCPEAVIKKYGKKADDDSGNNIDLPQKSGRVKFVEMVGFEKVIGKQSQFEKLTEVVVSLMQVSSSGEPGELKNLVPNATSLDLSCNLLVSWSQVAAITSQLLHLQSLVLSKNRLRLENHLENYQNSFSCLRIIVLNYMSYTWNDIMSCAVMWPSLHQLYACSNVITVLEAPPSPVFSRLSLLSLSNNCIRNWLEILKLESLINLEHLYLDDCHLENINFPDVAPSQKTRCFPNLHTLSVCKNDLSRWQDIAELNKLQQLRILRITNNPVVHSVTIETARQLVIAKVLNLEKLNKTEVTKCERKGAEFDYVKKYYISFLENGGQNDLSRSQLAAEFLQEHPTFPTLLQKHGAPEDSEISPTPHLLKNRLLSVQIFSSLCPNKSPVTKRLPATMPLCKVKGLIQRIFNVPAQDLMLTCLAADGVGQAVEMDNDLRELSFYSLSDGDKIDVRW